MPHRAPPAAEDVEVELVPSNAGDRPFAIATIGVATSDRDTKVYRVLARTRPAPFTMVDAGQMRVERAVVELAGERRQRSELSLYVRVLDSALREHRCGFPLEGTLMWDGRLPLLPNRLEHTRARLADETAGLGLLQPEG